MLFHLPLCEAYNSKKLKILMAGINPTLKNYKITIKNYIKKKLTKFTLNKSYKIQHTCKLNKNLRR